MGGGGQSGQIQQYVPSPILHTDRALWYSTNITSLPSHQTITLSWEDFPPQEISWEHTKKSIKQYAGPSTTLVNDNAFVQKINDRQNEIRAKIGLEALAVVTNLFVSIGMYCGIRDSLASQQSGFNFRDLHKPFVTSLDYKSTVQIYYLVKYAWDQNSSWLLTLEKRLMTTLNLEYDYE